MHEAELSQLRDAGVGGLRLQEQLTQRHLLAPEEAGGRVDRGLLRRSDLGGDRGGILLLKLVFLLLRIRGPGPVLVGVAPLIVAPSLLRHGEDDCLCSVE